MAEAARRYLFVTGTDTGVGKTTVSRALLSAWRRQGLAVTPLKPIETGCGDELLAQDAAALAAAAQVSADATCLLRYAAPVAPEAAAVGHTIDAAALVAVCQAVAGPRVLVEGAGGLLVPIAPGFTMADLAAQLGATVLIVARTRLGTLNHTLLTIAECRRRSLPIAGVILNRVEVAQGPEENDNVRLLRDHGKVPIWGPLPFLPEASLDALGQAAATYLPLAELSRAAGFV
jgi:dethiobiotin synthetase